MNTKIYVSANYIYKVEVTGNEEKPLSVTREYGRCRGNQWYAMDNKECPNVGLFIKNLGGVESVLAACKEVEDLSAWVEEHNAAAKEAHEKCHARAMAVQAEREAQRKAEYERLFQR